MRVGRLVRLLLFPLVPLGPTVALAQTMLVPYSSSGFHYAISTTGFPTGAELPSFDDSGFGVGSAPFTNGPACSSLIYTPGTNWPSSTDLVARLQFTVPWIVSGAAVHFGIDNDVSIYVNGQQVASVTHEGCANRDDFIAPIPDGLLVVGSNLLVALAVDRGGASGFDASVVAGSVTISNTMCGQASEGRSITLTAPVGEIIGSIDFASYGTPSGSCGGFALGICDATRSRTVVQAACLGKQSCTVVADNATFGDPCPGTPKQLCVQATAMSGPTPTRHVSWGALKSIYR